MSAAGVAADLRELLIPTTSQRYLLGGLTHVLPGVLIKPSISKGASRAFRAPEFLTLVSASSDDSHLKLFLC